MRCLLCLALWLGALPVLLLVLFETALAVTAEHLKLRLSIPLSADFHRCCIPVGVVERLVMTEI